MEIRTLQDLRVIVQARRKTLKMNQDALAERAGVSRRWISMFENGHEAAEVGRLLAVLNALDIRLTASTNSASQTSTDLDDGFDLNERGEAVDLRAVLRDYDDGDY